MGRHSRMVVACVGVLLAVMAWSAVGAELSTGGRAVFVGSALPSAGDNAEIDLFADYWNLEASSTTEILLFPYRTGSETIALSLVQDWLSLTAEYEFSIVPLGITATTILAQATPPAWVTACGSFLVDLAVEGEARLLGDSFGAMGSDLHFPTRTG